MVGLLSLAGEAGHQPPLHALDHRLRPAIPAPSVTTGRRLRPHNTHRQVRPRGHVVQRPEPASPTRNPEPE